MYYKEEFCKVFVPTQQSLLGYNTLLSPTYSKVKVNSDVLKSHAVSISLVQCDSDTMRLEEVLLFFLLNSQYVAGTLKRT